MGTNIRLNFKTRQGFLDLIVFGFCLGTKTRGRAYKCMCVNELQDQPLIERHDEIREKFLDETAACRATHCFPQGLVLRNSRATGSAPVLEVRPWR